MVPPARAVKVVVRLTPWPGAKVSGRLSPLLLNPVPDTVAWEIVRFELPLLLRTTDFDTLLPIGTLPKFTVEGLTASVRRRLLRIERHSTELIRNPRTSMGN